MIRAYFHDIHFEWPWAFALMALVPLTGWYLWQHRHTAPAALRISSLPPGLPPPSLKTRLRILPTLLIMAALPLLVIAIAGPYRLNTQELNRGKGLDIVLCLDVSGSMLAQDFSPNRLQASMDMARSFVEKRKGDRIGLVVFSGQSLTMCPPTTDHKALMQQLTNVNYGMLTDGTSIGSGLASAAERLRQATGKTKLIILLTDGEDTGGKIDPVTARDIAATFGIKVYTIGVGTQGYANIPYQDATGITVLEKEKVSIDEPLLQSIADETGGRYFRAGNRTVLGNIYNAIDSLETSDIKTTVFHKKEDAFFPFIAAALLLVCLAWMLRHTVFRQFP